MNVLFGFVGAIIGALAVISAVTLRRRPPVEVLAEAG